MDDILKRSLLNDILTKVGVEGIGNVILEQNNTINVGKEQPVQMPPYLHREEVTDLYRFLVSEGYIESSTSSEDFLYLMGVSATAPVKLKPINWLKTVQQLRTMLSLAFQDPLERKSLKIADIEKRAPFCFLNKGKKMSQLAKPTVENSQELDRLTNYFRPK